MIKIAVLLATGFEEVEAVTPIDFLRRAGIEVIVSGIETEMIIGSNGVAIKANGVIDDLPAQLDGVILPGGMPGATNLAQSAHVNKLLHQLNDNNKLIAAICAAPALVLGGAGLLKERRFTCYPGFENDVHDGVFCTERVIQDGNMITSCGPGSAAEFSIAVIEYLLGWEAAHAIKEGTLQKG